MALNIRLCNITTPNDFTIYYKESETLGNPYSGFIQYNGIFNGGTTEVIISGVTINYDTQYFIKIQDLITNRYIIENIYTHHEDYFVDCLGSCDMDGNADIQNGCYSEGYISLETNCELNGNGELAVGCELDGYILGVCDFNGNISLETNCEINGLSEYVTNCELGGLAQYVTNCELGGLAQYVTNCELGGLSQYVTNCELGGLSQYVTNCEIVGNAAFTL